MNSLITIREQHNITQTELARKLGISPQRYNLYEKGKRNLPVYIAVKISQIFKISLDEIFLPIN
ncbi:helix-turn-helix transcriptional regulator [Paraclostridium ghonii]|uniref:Transcriptional regulator n=1 Tax=Paraclostridium ghonii TaxID=29358 RepID=A0ABU0MX69_9FIRM|nr:helix-turn-helix transcriptional regulator [Paeniclostridium ghonii]MDQ0555505.1 putative transcriptional regulator [Paeniclostridium ghonii]